jgi:Mn2+/Fe2+ NRAMP family transporter
VEEINEKKERRLGDLFLLAFGLLAFGDSFHLGCRIAGNIKETLKGETVTNIGYGDLFGAITITLFYAVILVIWKERFQEEEKGYGLLGWILFLMVPVRFALMVPPQNDWGTLTPSQPWTSIRNIPLIIQGLSVALLILRDSCPVKDRVYQWFGILIVISYACVIPVVFAGQKYEQLGLLMIPKSIAYVAMALLAYYRYFSRTKAIDISIMHHVHAKILLEGFSPAKANSSELRLPR